MSIYLIVVIATLEQVAIGGSRVAVSLYALELGADQFTIGMMIALYSLCPMLLSIAIGKFSDRVSPRLPIVVGAAVMVMTLVLPVVFPAIVTLYAVAFLLGLFHQVFSIPLEVVVGAAGGPDKRARNYALFTMGWSIAGFFGPFIAGVSIDHIGYLPGFLILAAFAFVLIPMLWLVPELSRGSIPKTGTPVRGSALDLWRMPYLRITFITAGVIGSAWDLFQFLLPLFGHSVGLSASAIGVILGMVSAAAFVTRAILPFALKKYTEPRILTVAIFVAALAYLLLPFFTNAYALAAIAFLLGLGVGSALPLSMSMLYALTPAGRIAEAIGLHKTVRNATQLVIPIVFGSVGAAFGYTTVLLSNSLVLAVSGALLRRARVPDSVLHPE